MQKKQFKKNKMNNGRDRKRNFEREQPSKKDFSDIGHEDTRKTVEVQGMIDKIVQTGGPTIFMSSDGTGSLALKGFESPGERAYPDMMEGDTFNAVISISEYNGELEGEIKHIKKITGEEHKSFLEKIHNIQLKRAEVKPLPFLIKSPILEKLKDSFIQAAVEIRLAVIQKRPIIVRHHNDADGYSSGYVLERAILPLIEQEQESQKASWEYFMRSPCAAPFYEIDDSIRDAAYSLRNVAKFSNKMPLVIIADNGSSPEDLLAIQHGKVHGMEFIVIDHHFSDEDVISKEVLTHINPFLVGEDGAAFSAGMLCTELARMINPVENINQIPAMAGLADRIDLKNPKAIEDYLAIAKKEGYNKQLLMDISKVIDFVSAKIRFMEVREYIETVFGEPRETQKNLVNVLAPYIKNLEKKGLAIAKTNSETKTIGKTTLQTINIAETFPGFGFYPKPGMCVGLIHDDLQLTKKIKNVVTVGIMNTAITIRATDESNFSVHELIKFINNKSPDAFAEGGGHKNAGSISFLPFKQKEVLTVLDEFIESRQ